QPVGPGPVVGAGHRAGPSCLLRLGGGHRPSFGRLPARLAGRLGLLGRRSCSRRRRVGVDAAPQQGRAVIAVALASAWAAVVLLVGRRRRPARRLPVAPRPAGGRAWWSRPWLPALVLIVLGLAV